MRERSNGNGLAAKERNAVNAVAYEPIPNEPGTHHMKYASLQTRKSAKLERLTMRKKREWLERSAGHGFVRLFAPARSRSIVFPLTVETTVQDICSILGFEAIYLQIGGLHIRCLLSSAEPLRLQNEILSTIGYERISDCMEAGDATHLTHIFCFYMGLPEHSAVAGTSHEILVARCLVRKGRLLHKWTSRKCILYNGTIRVEHEGEDDEVILLSGHRVDVAEGSRGKYLRLSDSSHVYCFLFEAIGEMNLWLSRVVQTQMVPTCDLSDQRLLFLPDRLFSVGVERQIVSLNLRRNSLLIKPNAEARNPPLGWLDDVSRLVALRSVNIADNALHLFPLTLTQLSSLSELVLSGNRIRDLPPQIGLLLSLTVLNMSNNWLTSLPAELAECSLLMSLDLSFNHFEQIPDVIFSLRKLMSMQMAGNEIPSAALHALSAVHFQRVDLRRNELKRSVRLTSFIFTSLTHLDVRDNVSLEELDLSNLPTIQVLHCERLHLATLQINGASLRHLHADYNELSQVIIMPIPIHLVSFCVAYNSLTSLPDWITDLPQIETISVHHNSIRHLPYRIFMNVSTLRNLFANDNELERLPEVIENCSLEVLSLHCNRIDALPADLIRCAHKLRNLNVSHNGLTSLPPANSMVDLNKLQYLRASGNMLDESAVGTVVSCRRLRLLDLSYNQLRFFDDSCLNRLVALEEVNLSANRLTSISSAFGQLPSLQILRLHSNNISSITDLSHAPSLFLLDISNNELQNLNTDLCMAKTLKHLDLTCNVSLRVDTSTIRPKKSGRSVSVVDIGSESSTNLVQFGYSETAGQKNKLCIRQLRPSNNGRPVFGIVDGGSNEQIPSMVVEKLHDIVHTQNGNGAMSLKMALVRAHEHLGQMGERLGASALLLHVTNEHLYCANTGHVRAVLCRNGYACDITGDISGLTEDEYRRIRRGNATLNQENVIEGVCHSARSLGFSFLYPAVVPSPIKITVPMLDSDEFVIIASRALWKFLTPQQTVDLVRPIQNPQNAAKKLQDTMQSMEYGGNLSVIVIRFKKPQEDTQLCTSNVRRTHLELKYREELAFSDGDLSRRGETTLRNIEERLEQISEAISKIEDDSNNNRAVSNGFEQHTSPTEGCFKRSVRRTKMHRSLEHSRFGSLAPSISFTGSANELSCAGSGGSGSGCGSAVGGAGSASCSSRTASAASAPPDPQTVVDDPPPEASTLASTTMNSLSGAGAGTFSGLDATSVGMGNSERFSIKSRIELFNGVVGTTASRERFQRARLNIGERIHFETPSERATRQQLLL